MKLGIVHLSDLHIKDHTDPLLFRSHNIADAIADLPPDVNHLIILVSGDITFSSSNEQYLLASQFFDQIVDKVKKTKSLTPFFLMVPGNHDCDFTYPNPIRDSLIKSVRKDPSQFHIDFVGACCKVQNNFVKFVSQYMSEKDFPQPSFIYETVYLKFDKYRLRAELYNSSWMSSMSEEPGTLYIPVGYLPNINDKQPADLAISLIHHTPNWFQPENARYFSEYLEMSSHLIFTGHEHISSIWTKTRLWDNISTFFYEGDVLQERGEGHHSGFRIVLVDLQNRKFKVLHKKWQTDHYHVAESSDWTAFTASIRHSPQSFKLLPEFNELINDPGASFRHPRARRLSIKDIYIPPDLSFFDKAKRQVNGLPYRKISSSDIEFSSDGPNHVVVIGSIHSGKTTICLEHFKSMYEKGYVPVYVEGSSITSKSLESFLKLLDKEYSAQYSPADIDIFHNLPHKKKFIILDNFHYARLNTNAKFNLLASICETFPKVLCTGDLSLFIEDITAVSEGKISGFPDLKFYQILPFGHVLRSKLIEKWVLLGQEDLISRQELAYQHDHLKKIIDIVLGQNLVPSYPIFLLVILQRCEDEYPHDIQSSAYGYYYEYLIIQALRGIKKRNEDIDAYYNYITELANFLFENKRRELTRDNLLTFHKWYCEEYKISTDFEETIINLMKSQILAVYSDCYRFRYSYIYYFFVAKYLANNMTVLNIRDRVKRMCERLYQKEFSNIIIFLTHLSKDPFILEQVLNSSRDIFPGEEPQCFDRALVEISDLLEEVPRIVLETRDVDKEREKVLHAKDEISPPSVEETESLPQCDYDLDAQIKDPESIEHFTMSFLTIQVLGQILRNYYGSLKGNIKIDLGEEAYLIGLRATSRFYKKLITSKEYLVKGISNILVKEHIDTKDRAERTARHIIFYVCVFIPKYYISHISQSLGYDKLTDTFDDVIRKHDNIGFGIIDLAIRMDCHRAFPLGEAVSLLKRIGNNILPSTILKDLVVQHLYLFPRSERERQSICDRLRIPRRGRKKIFLTQKRRQKRREGRS